jgi:LAO/AO transport system kinase
MQNAMDDDKVFMRSIASRDAVGGVSKSLRNIIRVLDAAGYDLILVESVGAGQLEVEISKIVNLTAVVFTPNTGDNIQAIKAGLNEIGDLYIINKGDLDGATTLFNYVLDLIGNTERKPAVLKVSAKTGKGIKELITIIDRLLKVKSGNYKEKERKMLESELKDIVLSMIDRRAISMLNSNRRYFLFIDELANKKIDPYQAAEQLAAIIWR